MTTVLRRLGLGLLCSAGCVQVSEDEHADRMAYAETLGTYVGTIAVELEKGRDALSCDGELTLDVVAVDLTSLSIDGLGTCSPDAGTGDFVDVLDGDYTYVISGESSPGGPASGAVGGQEDPDALTWSGDLSAGEPSKIDGSFSGRVDFLGIKSVNVVGAFSAARED